MKDPKTGPRSGGVFLCSRATIPAMHRPLTIALAVAAAVLALPALADITGPARVIDGDTMTVDAAPWPGVTIRAAVRVDGIDAPEIRGRCQAEKDLAIRARDFVRAAVGETVQLSDIRHGKYAGRVVAQVETADGADLAMLLIDAGLGRAYDGGARTEWCE